MADGEISPQAIYTTLLQINQAVADMAAAVERLARSPASLETSGALAELVDRFDKAVPAGMTALVEAIKSMPAPRVVVQPAPVTIQQSDDMPSCSWVVDHSTNREGTITRSVITRTMSDVNGMTKQ